MLLFSKADQEYFDQLETKYEALTGSRHESASSLSDYQDCREKGKFRKMFRGVGLASLMGKVFHEFMNVITQRVMARCIAEATPYPEILEDISNSKELRRVYNKIVRDEIELVPIDVLTGKLLCKEKEKAVLTDIQKMAMIFDKCYAAFTPEFIKEILKEPPLASEIGGYLPYDDKCLLYGYIDKICLVNANTIRALDYKFKFSTKNKLLTPRYLFQLWIYGLMIADHKIPNITNVLKTLRYIKLKMPSDISLFWLTPEEALKRRNDAEQVKAAELGRKPRTYRKPIDALNLKFEIVDKEIEFSEHDNTRYQLKLESLLILKKYNLGFIGESQFGCNFCDYKGECAQGCSIEALDNLERDEDDSEDE